MPPRKKAGTADADPQTTRTVRSSARIASQAIPVAANSDPTINAVTSSKPPSKAKAKAPPKSKPASKVAQPTNKARSKRSKVDIDDGDDGPVPKKSKTAPVDEEEDTMEVDTQDNEKDDKKDDRKMVTFPLCYRCTPAHFLLR